MITQLTGLRNPEEYPHARPVFRDGFCDEQSSRPVDAASWTDDSRRNEQDAAKRALRQVPTSQLLSMSATDELVDEALTILALRIRSDSLTHEQRLTYHTIRVQREYLNRQSA